MTRHVYTVTKCVCAVTKQYVITCLLNDKPYLIRVAALNLYGLGAWEQIGPLTPRW